MIIRPFGIILNGCLEHGFEVVIEDGIVAEIRPQTGIPENFILSPAFVNAHSHLEYRNMLGQIQNPEYWGWIWELTAAKGQETLETVRAACILAAQENRKTGVAVIAEHSDRPFSGEALELEGLQGTIFQEIIANRLNREERLVEIRQNANINQKAFSGPVFMSPHAYQTVTRSVLEDIALSDLPFSMHVAETAMESQLTLDGSGAIADRFRSHGAPVPTTGMRLVPTLAEIGLVRGEAQFVHCCDFDERDIELLTEASVGVAHCPRSNVRLKCPTAPVRRMLESGLQVGLGLDSPASSGPIDMFAEMRAALSSSIGISEPLTSEQVWHMATTMGFHSFSHQIEGSWKVEIGSRAPLISIQGSPTESLEEIIERSSPADVSWVLT